LLIEALATPVWLQSVALDLVGQLIRIAGPPGEMFGQQFTGFSDTVNYARGELGFAEVTRHLVGQLRPEIVTAARMDPRIANHCELVRARRHKDQDAIMVPGFLHAHLDEVSLGAGERVRDQLSADEYPDFT